MAKSSEYEHHQPRTIQKNKKKKVFNEEAALENRGSRVSFKNYIRQLEEDEIQTESEGGEWAVKRGIFYEDGSEEWAEMAIFLTEEEAQEEADNLSDAEPEDSGAVYRVEPV